MSASNRALNILAKWRVVLTGWQLGTRQKGDPTSDAVSDHRELSLLMRVELNALVQLLVANGVFTAEEFDQQLKVEAELYEKQLQTRFPGAWASIDGMHFDKRAAEWMGKFPQ